MSALDPSYLRSIRDGILNGNIEANNQEALPDGLVGLYDQELFPPTMKWKERKETLHFFLVFALAQKEISADFAARILSDERYNYSEEDSSKEEKRLQRVNELIQRHSKRFSSAGSGKYRLYHERFRLYVLQKVTEQDITQFNAKFIAFCDTALESTSEKDISEKESYALEFISTHYFIGAMQGETECLNKEHATALKKYAYDQQFWERQIKASKGFEWSKRMLNEMMAWASKFNEEDEVIECALSKVDLYHQEQNDAPRIVQLVADGDLETALERIEKFGGQDKEGLQRKFILYMLCLMELTLLDSKNKDHAKSSIEKLLKHFDENIPANEPDLINWNDFFPSYLVFEIACECSKIDLNGIIIYYRTLEWDFDWIPNKINLNYNQLKLLSDCKIKLERQNQQHRNILKRFSPDKSYISTKPKEEDFDKLRMKILSFFKKYENISQKTYDKIVKIPKEIDDCILLNDLDKLIFLIDENSLPGDRCKILLSIVNQAIDNNDPLDIEILIQKTELLINEMPKHSIKSLLSSKLSSVFFRLDNRIKSSFYINKSIELISKIEKKWEKDRVFRKILNELLIQGNLKLINSILYEQLIIKQLLNNESGIDDAINSCLGSISKGFIDRKKSQQSLSIINLIKNKNHKDAALIYSAKTLSFYGQYIDSIDFCRMIRHKESRITNFLDISSIAFRNGYEFLTKEILIEATETAKSFINEKLKEESINEIESFKRDLKNKKVSDLNHHLDKKKTKIFDIELIENNGSNISSINERIYFWEEIGRSFFHYLGYSNAILKSSHLKSSEARYYVKREIINSLDVNKINFEIMSSILKDDSQEMSLKNYILQIYTLNQLFFSNLPQEKLDRYNRTLNLQWAIDIKNQLPN
jgi:hypothetical protein